MTHIVWVATGLACLCLVGSTTLIVVTAGPAPAAAHLAAAVGVFVVAVILRVDVRVGSNRLVCVWGDTAFVLALVLLPLPWVVSVTTIGKAAAMVLLRLQPIKAIYNTSAHTIAATIASATFTVISGTSALWQIRLGTLLACGVVYDLVCSAMAAAIVGTANGSNPIVVWRASLGMQTATMAGNLAVTAGALVLATFDPRLILALPLAAIVLHQAYKTLQRGRAERVSGRHLGRAITDLGRLDEDAVLSRTAAHAAELLSAASAEVVHYTSSPGAADEVYSYPDGGPPHEACRWTQAVDLVDPDGDRPVGEIRVHFTQPVTLAERDHAALHALAAASRNALAAARARTQVAYLATHDPLTSLPIRPLLLERVDAHLGQAQLGIPVGMIVVGLVGFAEIAHTLGHEARDHLLRHAASRLRQATTRGEITARLDDCDFGVFVPEVASLRHLSGRAESLLAALSTPTRLPLGAVSLDANAGIAYAPTNTVDSAELLRQATVALARTRHTHTPVEYYRAADDTSSGPATLLIAAELQQALLDDQLTLLYQPIIDLNDGTPVAAEATVHWLHPTRGFPPPHEFLPILEHASLLTPYTNWLLREAFAGRAGWTDLEHTLPVSINLPARCLYDRDLPERVLHALTDAGLHANQVMLEVTESAILSTAATVDAVLDRLRGIGLRIAIDDFGSAHSSLTRLIRVPVTDLKISPTIVGDMLGSPEARAIVAAAAEMARSIDVRVIAVGVRTPEHLLMARDAGAHAAQGNAIAAPQAASTTYTTLLDRTREFAAESTGRVIRLRPKHDLDDPA